ncbi:DUF2637 domain-containing protein [Streptomyces sp900105755]|uniref:DUF2637 domain-containing protein n=1 Tax=Streptomyces sp. 900105755 TaxID=3154389 RepID=A0ABV1TV77_9ACTN
MRRDSPALRLTRTHRILIGVTLTGTMTTAGIGFTGSYTALRELAIKKGFGNFASVFPIGIDAGICVLLALDLLLTWIRIPFPLLRPTAWLLTIATIAFNGAAAWPDPLGVGMHAVIPVLFVVAVEAARHAIGRIADITADKHMEGVRLTRWLLSPVPTFLLWRRMKLWELRSYDQAIKLEQERLIYQARLRSHYGRAWRTKAPVESLMPLRLAKYGIPLTDTAPNGLAAGIKLAEPLPDSTSAPSPDSTAGSRGTGTTRAGNGGTSQTAQALEKTPADKPEPAASPHPEPAAHEPEQTHDPEVHPRLHAGDPQQTEEQDAAWYEQAQQRNQHDPLAQEERQPLLKHPPSQTTVSVHKARPARTQGQHTHRHATGPARHAFQHDTTTMSNSQPTTTQRDDPTPETARHQESTANSTTTRAWGELHDRLTEDNAPSARADRESATASAHALRKRRGTTVAAAIGETPQPSKNPADAKDPTLVDRYYQIWLHHRTQHGREPTPGELSALLAHHGMLGRDNHPINPSTLRRYLLPFRLYTVWAEHRTHTTTPSPHTVAHDCNHRGITAQHNKPITPTHINKHTNDFQRRWHTHTHHNPTP